MYLGLVLFYHVCMYVYKRDFREFNEESFIDDICIQNWTAKNPAGTNPKIADFLWR